eukprot:snap_masked-scaffold_24-processed-gene-1.9-mRNA-1 protein AED:1.00 eAED:1.00 QI:0/0/0/0/1/1/2/0/1171
MESKSVHWAKYVTTPSPKGNGEEIKLEMLEDTSLLRRKRVKYPKFNKPLSPSKLKYSLKYIKKRLDVDALTSLLHSENASLVSQQFLEVIIGKCLISDDLEKAKFVLDLGKETYKNISVSNEYFDEFNRLGKRSFKKMIKGSSGNLLFMSIVRQGKYENVEFMIKNMHKSMLVPVSVVLDKAVVYDGNMLHAEWRKDLVNEKLEEIEDELDKEMLKAMHKLDLPPQKKYLITHFEGETLLSAALKLLKDTKDAASFDIVKLLVESGCQVKTERFKAAQVCAELDFPFQLEYLRTKYLKQNKKENNQKQFFRIIAMHAAMENNQRILKYIRLRLFPRKRPSLQKEDDKFDLEIDFRNALESSIKKLVDYGTERICTYRHRILYGIFVLLQWRSQLQLEWGKTKMAKSVKGKFGKITFVDDSVTTTATQALKKNYVAWKRKDKGILAVNDTTDYISNVIKLLGPGEGDDPDFVGSEEKPEIFCDKSLGNSSTGQASNKSNLSFRSNKKYHQLVSKRALFNWLLAILQQQDYHGDQLFEVLLGLGLKDFFLGGVPSDEQSEVSSSLGESTTTYESDQDSSSVYSKKSGTSMTSRWSGSSIASSLGSMAKGVKKVASEIRRKSSLAGLKELLETAGMQLQNLATGKKVKTKNKADSDDKTQALELASDFGNKQVMEQLLDLIAPEWNQNVLKCLHIAISKNRAGSTRALYSRLWIMYESVEHKASLGDKPGTRTVLKNYAKGVEGYFSLVEARQRTIKNEILLKKKKIKTKATEIKHKRRKSISQHRKEFVRKLSRKFSWKSGRDSDSDFGNDEEQESNRILKGATRGLRRAKKSISDAVLGLRTGKSSRGLGIQKQDSLRSKGMYGAKHLFYKLNKDNRDSKNLRRTVSTSKTDGEESLTSNTYNLPNDPKNYVKFVQDIGRLYFEYMYKTATKGDRIQALMALNEEINLTLGKKMLHNDVRRRMILDRLRSLCSAKSRVSLKDEKVKAVTKYMSMITNDLTLKKYHKETLQSLISDIVKNLGFDGLKHRHVEVFEVIVTESEEHIVSSTDLDTKINKGILTIDHILTILETVGVEFDRERSEYPDDPTVDARFWSQGEILLDFIVEHLNDASLLKYPTIAIQIDKRNLQGRLPHRIISHLRGLAILICSPEQIPLVENSFSQLYREDEQEEVL